MKLSRGELKALVVEVAKANFGDAVFQRRPLMLAVEERLRADGQWTIEDDFDSNSTGAKSKGLEAIDYAISDLKRTGGLRWIDRDQWRAP